MDSGLCIYIANYFDINETNVFGKPTYRGYSSSNKKTIDVALFSSITSTNDDGTD
ncbi:hypothetical protein G5716_28840 [Bacillus pacificus]|nr:hypothetical protein [Bacillus pacificus]